MARAVEVLRHPTVDPDGADRSRSSALAGLERSRAEIEATGDVVARAVTGLVGAHLSLALGGDEAEAAAAAEAAEAALVDLGIDAHGWRTVLAMAKSPAPA